MIWPIYVLYSTYVNKQIRRLPVVKVIPMIKTGVVEVHYLFNK
jgi:hypothetical protein